MSKHFSLSIIIFPFKSSKKDLVLSLIDIDYYLSKLRYSSVEILIVDDNKLSGILEIINSFKKYLPNISRVFEQDILDKISGEKVLVFNSKDKIYFKDFKKMVDISKSSCDLALFKKKSNHSILDKCTNFIKRILRIKQKIEVVSNKGMGYFKYSVIKDLFIINFLKSVFFGFLYEMNVKIIDTENDNFRIVFLDYLKIWMIMLLYDSQKIIKKIWRK